MQEARIFPGMDRIEAVDEIDSFRMIVTAPADQMIIAPVESLSQSEKGFDRIYQGSMLLLAVKPNWNLGVYKFSVGISIQPL